MFEEKDVILEAKHITRKFPASNGRMLLQFSLWLHCNGIRLIGSLPLAKSRIPTAATLSYGLCSKCKVLG